MHYVHAECSIVWVDYACRIPGRSIDLLWSLQGIVSRQEHMNKSGGPWASPDIWRPVPPSYGFVVGMGRTVELVGGTLWD